MTETKRPRRMRGAVAAMTAAGLLVAGAVGGVVADSVATDPSPSAASSPAAGSGSNGGSNGGSSSGNELSAQTVADPATLAGALDHTHDGITVPEGEAAPADASHAPGAEGTPVDAGVEVQDAPGVLLVETETSYGEGAGSGMVLSADGLALTNYHVVDGSSEVEVTVADTGETHTAEVMGRDAAHDVAVLQLQDASGLDTASVDPSGVDTGEDVAAVGNGSGQGYLTAVSGTVTGVDQSISAERLGDAEDLTGLIATDADVVPGYSGGPLVDDDGQVVGMSTAASTGETSEQVNGFGIGITEALGIADQIVAGTESDSVQVGASGALGVTVTDAAAGALVVEVAPGSAAESAGLVAGDTVTVLDGTEVADSAELSDQVGSSDPGDSVTLTWADAEGAEHSATVDLGESTVN
ncbi:trypsin-like peptidase domain-containing protein [Citricoccus sp. NPDC055426]|uniref:S1C family serine protease n=1 Tax=Citricoccus sp. NPDC055426 TaxID=3155536 RepID=UPI003413511B